MLQILYKYDTNYNSKKKSSKLRNSSNSFSKKAVTPRKKNSYTQK